MSEYPRAIDPHLSLQERLQWTQHADPDQLSLLSKQATQEATDRIHRDVIPWLNASEIPFYDGVLFLHSTHVSGNEHILLSPTQAALPFYQKYKTLGGVVRSPEDPGLLTGVYEPYDPQEKERVQIFLAPSALETEKLLHKLAVASERVFPPHNSNALINNRDTALYLSAIQMTFLAIHPFFEANGKVSEDMLFVLWNRQPNAKEGLRYPSSDGLRGHDGNAADQREEINYRAFHAISKAVAAAVAETFRVNHIGAIDTTQVNTFTDLQKAAATAGIPDSVLFFTYDQEITKYLQGLIRDIGNGDTASLQKNSFLNELAQNLEDSSRTYRFADGTTL